MLWMSEKVFDKYAEKYDSWYDRNPEVFRKEVECLISIIDAEKPWLEIGVGSGRFAEKLGIEYGIDPSEKMVRIARQRGINAIVGYGEDLPYEDESFGAVFLIVTLCFVKDPIKVLREAWRVLKKGGKIYIGFVPRESELGRVYMEKASRGHVFYSVARFFSTDEVVKMLRECGFEVLKIKCAGLEIKDFCCIEGMKRL